MTSVVSKKEAVAGAASADKAAAPGANVAESLGTIHEFVCNRPNQVLRFADGSAFQWPNPRTFFVTADQNLARKLIAEGGKFGVIKR